MTLEGYCFHLEYPLFWHCPEKYNWKWSIKKIHTSASLKRTRTTSLYRLVCQTLLTAGFLDTSGISGVRCGGAGGGLEVPEQSLLAQFFFCFHDLVFFFIEKKLHWFLSPIFFNLLEHFKASPIYFLAALNFFLQFSRFSSLPTLAWCLILLRRTWWTVLIHVSQRHPRYNRRRFQGTMCEPYKSLKTI